MLYRSYEIEGVKHPFTIPQSWQELTLKQAIGLSECDDSIMCKLVVVSGVPNAHLGDAGFFNVYTEIDNATHWMHHPITDNDTEPITHIDIGERLIKVPTSLRANSVGQYEDMKVIVGRHQAKKESSTTDYYKLVAAMAAIYLEPEYNGTDYDYQKAEKFATDTLSGCKFLDILSIGYFFLTSLIASRNGTGSVSHPPIFMIKKFLLDIKTFLRNGVSMPIYIAWRVVIS